MTGNRTRQMLSTAALLTAALATAPALGQVAVQNGSALDANQQVGSGGYNQAGAQVDYRARNLLITGEVGGGRAFRGSVDYRAAGSFQGSLGSDSLFNFRRDSVYSAPGAAGIGYQAQQVGNRVIVSRPTDSAAGYRVSGGNGLSTRTSYDPSAGVVTFRQSGGGLVAITGVNNPSPLGRTGNSLGLLRTPQGLVDVNASTLTGIRYNPLDVNTPRIGPNTNPLRDTPEPLTEEQRNTVPENSVSQNLRIDASRPAFTNEDLADLKLNEDPLAITLGTQVQSQMALQLAGRNDNNIPESQAMSIRERVFGPKATTPGNEPAQPPQAKQNPYDKLIADIIAQSMRPETEEPDDTDEPEVDTRPRWKQILEEPEQAVLDAKLKARETAMRISLGLVDEDGIVDYETELPSIKADSELGKLLEDLSYDLPRMRTLAGQDENRINKLLTRGEQELKAERYIVAENIYRQVLRETQGDALAKAGLIHSQMGAGMIRSAAFNLRGLFADHPELVALKYDAKLMPQTDRLRWLQGRLQKMIGEEIHGADPGLVLAYLGYQLEAKPLIEFGLAVAESEAPRDPLMPVLRKIWLEGDAQDDGAKEADAPAEDKPAADPALEDAIK